jgi:hypothetical protein
LSQTVPKSLLPVRHADRNKLLFHRFMSDRRNREMESRTYPLVFKCPVTGINVITDISIRKDDEQQLPRMTFGITCPCCESVHQFTGDKCRKMRRNAA